MRLFITAIGTDCGKTVTSAIFCQALKADYWKPVQTGTDSDSGTIASLVSFPVIIHPETYRFSAPLSPHEAAAREGITIEPGSFKVPSTDRSIIMEGAGGVLVPLTENGYFLADFAAFELFETVVVVRFYLGCINHALLTLNELNRRNIKVKGLVLNGNDEFGAEKILSRLTHLPVLLRIRDEQLLTRDIILHYAQQLVL